MTFVQVYLYKNYIGRKKLDSEPLATFYMIDPGLFNDSNPKPVGLSDICARNENGVTQSLMFKYDPYNTDQTCESMLLWVDPTPNTTPVYIYKRVEDSTTDVSVDSPLLFSLTSLKLKDDAKKGYILNLPHVIYMLAAPTKFVLYQDRCLPAVDTFVSTAPDISTGPTDQSSPGDSLKDCMGKIPRNNIEPTIINFLREKYKNYRNRNFRILGFSIFLGILGIFCYLYFSQPESVVPNSLTPEIKPKPVRRRTSQPFFPR